MARAPWTPAKRLPVTTLLLGIALLVGCSSRDRGRPVGDVVVGAGVHDPGWLQEEHTPSAGALVEYRAAPVWKCLRPIVGVQAAERRTGLVYAGAAYDIRLARRLILTPSFSVGARERGDGKESGSVYQFRSAIEAAYERPNGHRIGLLGQHVSNGDFTLPNPGSEGLYATYSLPIRARR